ncbi:PAS domain S-box protein [Phenylobacterium sp.]|uniref:PAS domain S-box protein n=1 Tax=Phenylobacterium sp. TaxID=1871053 RepID=UPI0025FC6B69|nr:PAS domain S-box protein [Phenylobacterium sp.]
MSTPPPGPASNLVDLVSDHALYGLDAEGHISQWSGGAAHLYGYAEAEALRLHYSQLFTAEDRTSGSAERLLEFAAAEGRAEIEGWRQRRGGGRFWADGVVRSVRDEAGVLVGYVAVVRDATRRRQTQEALALSERRFRLLVEEVVDYAIVMLDLNGLVSSWNRGAELITGYAREEVIGRHVALFDTPEDRRAAAPARALESALRDGRFETEGWRVRKGGERFWASIVVNPIHDDDGGLLGFAKIIRDTTERRKAQEALAESERQFRTLVSGVVDYSIFMLDPNGIVTNWNAGAQHIKGYAAGEIVGQHFSRFYTEEDRAAGVPLRALKTATDQGRYEAEGWRVRKDGSLFWASVIIDRIREADGSLIGFAKITRDITEKRNAQLELQRAHEQLAQSQKLEALGKLTGGVAHDFNNLLMVVSGQAQLLRRKVRDDARAVRALDAIEAAAHRGEDLTRHLLSFARRQRLTPAPTSLTERSAGLRELLAASLPATVRLETNLPDGLWPVTVDAGEFELALLNLTVNARDAMPKGGVLSLTAENVTLDGHGPGNLRGDFVALSLADTGSGIAPDILPKVFDPFFTTKDVNKGTGLGLSQVFGFAQQSGGHIAVDSELGLGTRFTLYLPRSSKAPVDLDEAEPTPLPGSVRILLVEDNPEVADVAARMLEELGHEVRVASSGLAALALLEREAQIDLIFSDIVMAGELDGLDMARQARERRPDLPVVLATGYSEAAARIGEEFPILRKPYRLADLNRAIAAALGRRAVDRGQLVDLDTARRVRNGNGK